MRKKKDTYTMKSEMIFSLGHLREGDIPEIKLRLNRSSRKRLYGKISEVKDAADFIRHIYQRGEIELQEQFIVIYLDRANNVIGYYRHAKGGITGTVADVRIILAAALKSASTSIILAHNHPSGNLKPSDADISLTRKIKQSAELMDITVMDHIIITKDGYFSFADEGLVLNGADTPKKILSHGSLFSGIGGFELAAKNAGVPTLWNCEIEEFTRNVLKKNFPLTKQYTDITTLKNPEYVDIISGGFPCQDISAANANAKGIKGAKSGLWNEMARVISEVRPKYVIIENSPRLVSLGLEKVLWDLSKIGYHAQWECLQAGQFGFSHKRERIFIVAYSDKVRQQYAAMVGSGATTQREGEASQRFDHPKIFEQSSCNEFIKEAKKKIYRMPEPEFSRMDDGVSCKLDRVGALGNAIVPSIAEYIFSRIMKIEGAMPNSFTKIDRMKELELAANILRLKLSKAA